MLQIPDDLARRLDELVADGFENRTEALRRAIEEFVSRQERARVDRAIVEGYERFPPASRDEWGVVGDEYASAAFVAGTLDDEDGGW